MEAVGKTNSLRIVINDFDSPEKSPDLESPSRSSMKSTQEILREAEQRKHQFFKLIDEHSALIEKLKKIEEKKAADKKV